MGVKPASEAGFMRTVIEYASLRNWLVFHDADSRKNPAGLPDLILVRNGVLVAAELKSAKGRLRSGQRTWLEALGAVAEASNGAVKVFVWRPADWAEVVKTLE